MKFQVTIKGICPLLQHRFLEGTLTAPKQRKGDKGLTEKDKREIASNYLYEDRNTGKLCVPSIHIESAMQKAASEFRIKGGGKKTYKDLIKAVCFVFPEFIPLKNQKWEVDERAVVNASTRGRVMSYRPRFDEWELDFTLEVNDDRADAETIKEILTYAGLYKAVGAYRPRFGRFEVKKIKQID
jgi:hypothetical protein